MKKLSIGDVTITSIIERDGPWRTPQEMFPAYDPIIANRQRSLTPKSTIRPRGKWSSPIRPISCVRPGTRCSSIRAPARTKAIRRQWTFRNGPGSMVWRQQAYVLRSGRTEAPERLSDCGLRNP